MQYWRFITKAFLSKQHPVPNYIADFFKFWNIYWEQTYKSIFSKDFYFWHFLSIFLAHSGKRYIKASKTLKKSKRKQASIWKLCIFVVKFAIPPLYSDSSPANLFKVLWNIFVVPICELFTLKSSQPQDP